MSMLAFSASPLSVVVRAGEPQVRMNSSLVIAPTRLARFGYAIFECVTAAGMIVLAQPWLKPIGAQRFSLVGFGVVLVAAGLEFPWRRVIIRENVVRERLWFHWRTHDLPYRVMVGRDNRGRVVVAEAP